MAAVIGFGHTTQSPLEVVTSRIVATPTVTMLRPSARKLAIGYRR
jgi:hypothetical protein